jgi:hypothetical protein
VASTLSAEQRRLRASIAAHAMHAKNDSRVTAAKGQAGLVAKFRKQVEREQPGLSKVEIERRADHLYRAHMQRLALASSRARSKAGGAG